MKTNEPKTDSRPLAERITQGIAEGTMIRKTYDGCMTQESIVIRSTGDENGTVAEVTGFIGFPLSEENKADARLIVQAFNVAHETGRTPRQLAEDVKELRASCEALLAIVDRLHRDTYAPNVSSDWKEQADARAVLAKTEPRKQP